MRMEVDVSSPISQEEEEIPAIIPPGLDMLVEPQGDFDAQSDEPVAGLQSPFTPAGSPDSPGGSSISPDGGPATPGGDVNEESMDGPQSPPAPSSDEEREEEVDAEEEEEKGDAPSSPLESSEELDDGVHTPGPSPPVEEEQAPASPEEENDNNAISFAFLSGRGAAEEQVADDGDEEALGAQEVMIPFLGDSTVPVASPGGEEDEEEEAAVMEEAEKEPEEEAPAEVDMGMGAVPTAVEEEVVATTEEAEEVVMEETEVRESHETPQVAEEEEVAAQEPASLEEAQQQQQQQQQQEEAPAASSPAHSPEQVVEEVFLSTEAAGKGDASDESEFEGFEAAEATTSPGPRARRKRRLIVEDDDDEEEEERPRKAAVEDESDFEGFEPEEEKKGDRQGLIDDIFGHSDDEGEFDGFAETEVQPAREEEEEEAAAKEEEEEKPEDGEKKKKKKKEADGSSSSSDEGVADGPAMPTFTSDFEEMMMKKKEENRRRRRRRGDDITIINNSDDIVVALISDMKIAAKIDRDLIMQRQPAIQKMRMLGQVVSMLRKADMQMALIDCGVLSAITEWLSPLPDRSLPALQIRSNLLQALGQLPGIGADSLKESGVGKAVMYLNKHPKETPENRRTAGKLIYNWSRPIFNLTSDYKLLSKEARQKRDMDNLPKKRRISADADATPKRDIDREMSADNTPLRPGDPGWVARARVPMPSNKDYVYRPRPKVENAVGESTPKKMARFEKHLRKFKDSKAKNSKFQKAVGMSLEGRKMSL